MSTLNQVSTKHYRKTASLTQRGIEKGTTKIEGRHIELIQLLIYCEVTYIAPPASPFFLNVTVEFRFLVECYMFCIMCSLQN